MSWSLGIKLRQRLSAPRLSETFTGSAIFSLHGPSLRFIIDRRRFSLIDHSRSRVIMLMLEDISMTLIIGVPFNHRRNVPPLVFRNHHLCLLNGAG